MEMTLRFDCSFAFLRMSWVFSLIGTGGIERDLLHFSQS